MFQKGFPVPDGFIIFPSAFENGKLAASAQKEIRRRLIALRNKNGSVSFSARSSAAGEDSERTSFAGEY